MQSILVALIVSALPTPHISGPSHVRPGEFAILTATLGDPLTVDGLGKPASPAGKPFEHLAYGFFLEKCDKQFAVRRCDVAPTAEFITNDKGRYVFRLVVSDGQTISDATHVLTVGDSPSPPSPGPPDPSPVPSPSRFGITEAARQWVAEVPASDLAQATSFAAELRRIADTVLEKKQPRHPQDLLDEMVAAANKLGNGWTDFRSALKAFTTGLIQQQRFQSAQDVAIYLQELATGVSEP